MDVDLTYIPIEDRETSFTNISVALTNIKSTIEKRLQGSRVEHKVELHKLLVSHNDAIIKIESFINKNQQLSIWSDPEIAALQLEIKNIENQINAFDNEKIELEKVLADFQYQHSIELGEIILDILKLRSIKFKNNKEKFEEAKRDEEEYQGQFEAEKEKDRPRKQATHAYTLKRGTQKKGIRTLSKN